MVKIQWDDIQNGQVAMYYIVSQEKTWAKVPVSSVALWQKLEGL